MLRDAHNLLRKDGVILLLNHNIRSWFPRIFGERCPMYDIEHIYLFDKRTVARLLENNGFDMVKVRNIPNSYTLSYAVKMFPLPNVLKLGIMSLCESSASPTGWADSACRPGTCCRWDEGEQRSSPASRPERTAVALSQGTTMLSFVGTEVQVGTLLEGRSPRRGAAGGVVYVTAVTAAFVFTATFRF